MFALLLGALLTFVPADSTNDLDACLAQAPSRTEPPITWGSNVERMWGDSTPASPSTIRAQLSQVRDARDCFLDLDPSKVERPYFGNIMRTYSVETALLAALRRFSEAFDVFEAGRSYYEAQPQADSIKSAQGWVPSLHQNQGYLHYLLGDLSASLQQYLKAYESTPEEETSQRIQFLIDVGILHQRMQDYASARYYYERAERHVQQSDVPPEENDTRLARIFFSQADLLLEETMNTEFDREAVERARDLSRKARDIADPGTEQHARITSALSESLGFLGSFDEAYQLNEEVRHYAQSSDNARLQTFALLKLGVLHMQTEQWAPAQTVLEETLPKAEDLGDFDYQRRIFRALGRLHEIQEEWSSAENYYREGVSVIEEYRESLTATQWSMTAFSQWQDVHRGLVRSLLAQGREREALAVLDRTRARHLRDLRTQGRISNQLSADQRVRFDSLTQALTDVRNELGRRAHSSSEEARLRDREASLMAARRQLLDFDSTASRPTLDSVQRNLEQKNRALVSYFIDDPWTIYDRSPHSTAFVLTADTLRTVPLEGVTETSLRGRVEAISPLFTTAGKPERLSTMHFDLKPLHELHQDIYAPVADLLPDERPLTVIPDGPLFHVPPSMLVQSMPGGRHDHRQARFVLHERPTALELASSLTVDTAEVSLDPSQFDPNLSAFGVSDFDTLETVPSALRTALPEATADSSLVLPALPGVQSELNAVQRAADNATVAHNEAATETAVKKATQQSGVLHLASHAFVHPSSPLQNAFLLHSDSSASDPSDGVLFLHELQAQKCQVPLVVLSGCSTARGTLREGEGLAGLQYAFRAMGAQSTVANLWPAADQASVALMSRFYQNLRDGMSKDRALQHAKLDFLQEHPNNASPFFWAPAVLYGSPAPVDLGTSPRSTRWAWSALGLVAVLLLLGLLFWKASPPLPPWLRRQLPS